MKESIRPAESVVTSVIGCFHGRNHSRLTKGLIQVRDLICVTTQTVEKPLFKADSSKPISVFTPEKNLLFVQKTHPYARLKREEPTDALSKPQAVDNQAAAEWLAKYWETREQRAPTLRGKLGRKADQEQRDPLEFLPSDEEDDEKSGAQRRLQEQRERLHGALALIELANLTGAPLRQ
ncbi:hypothetical protein Celaphus_00017033 [Cervus elaphus hippelaphus]|uniref:Uncharacterized protein n=1 Tax=Cervus elaphus hippelaphus TaxID=46360 RepID=A0A212CN03_CEREH|nr:hypothetical protein Celaphus_00017033 [Cervus elaphus hippelaphus]